MDNGIELKHSYSKKENEIENLEIECNLNFRKAISTNESNFNLKKSNSSEHKNKFKILLKDTIELKSGNEYDSSDLKKSTSVWRKFRNKVSNIKNNLKYNTLTMNSFLDYYKFILIKIFDKIYFTKDDLEKYCHDIYHIIYISYRNEFSPIYNKTLNKNFVTDCGWGCMIRSAQMMLARGIQLIKISEYDYNCKIYTGTSKLNVIFETILLFLDNYLLFDEIKENKNYVEIVESVIKKLDEINLEGSNITSIDKIVKSVLPPFSVQNICKVGELFGKKAGEWFSDVNMINIFAHLNEEFSPIENLEIINFYEGVVYGDVLLKKCFEFTPHENQNQNQNQEKLTFKKSAIIHISLRLGLNKISSTYFQLIKEIFDIPNNLGIIGGKANEAHYFIGTAGDYLLYLDPHFNQKSIKSCEDLNKNYSTYLKKQVYQTSIKNISPAFTIGFIFRNYEEYIKLIQNLKIYSERENSIFHFQEKEKEKEGNFNKGEGNLFSQEINNKYINEDNDDF